MTGAPVDRFASFVTVAPAAILVEGSTTVTLQAVDFADNNQTAGGLKVAFGLGGGSAGGTFSSVTDNGDGTYAATFIATSTGMDSFTATINGQVVTTMQPTITVGPAPPPARRNRWSRLRRRASRPAARPPSRCKPWTPAATTSTPAAQAVRFALRAGNATGVFGAVTDNHDGTYTASFMGILVGSSTITATLNGQNVTSTLPTIVVTPGLVSLSRSTLTATAASVPVLGRTTVTLQAKDGNGNNETTGGLVVTMGNVAPPALPSAASPTTTTAPIPRRSPPARARASTRFPPR